MRWYSHKLPKQNLTFSQLGGGVFGSSIYKNPANHNLKDATGRKKGQLIQRRSLHYVSVLCREICFVGCCEYTALEI
jgi:hypothetical protein